MNAKPVTTELKKKVLELRKNGTTFQLIAKKTGLTIYAIRRIILEDIRKIVKAAKPIIPISTPTPAASTVITPAPSATATNIVTTTTSTEKKENLTIPNPPQAQKIFQPMATSQQPQATIPMEHFCAPDNPLYYTNSDYKKGFEDGKLAGARRGAISCRRQVAEDLFNTLRSNLRSDQQMTLKELEMAIFSYVSELLFSDMTFDKAPWEPHRHKIITAGIMNMNGGGY